MTYWKVNFYHATENFEYWKAFYCKFTTDAGADDLIQAFVEANGGNENTQINTWSIKFGQSQESEKCFERTLKSNVRDNSLIPFESNGAPYSFSQKFEIEKARPDGATEGPGLFYLKFNVVTFLRKSIWNEIIWKVASNEPRDWTLSGIDWPFKSI